MEVMEEDLAVAQPLVQLQPRLPGQLRPHPRHLQLLRLRDRTHQLEQVPHQLLLGLPQLPVLILRKRIRLRRILQRMIHQIQLSAYGCSTLVFRFQALSTTSGGLFTVNSAPVAGVSATRTTLVHAVAMTDATMRPIRTVMEVHLCQMDHTRCSVGVQRDAHTRETVSGLALLSVQVGMKQWIVRSSTTLIISHASVAYLLASRKQFIAITRHGDKIVSLINCLSWLLACIINPFHQ